MKQRYKSLSIREAILISDYKDIPNLNNEYGFNILYQSGLLLRISTYKQSDLQLLDSLHNLCLNKIGTKKIINIPHNINLTYKML